MVSHMNIMQAGARQTLGHVVPVATNDSRHFADFDLTVNDVKSLQVGNGDTFYGKLLNAVNLVNENIVSSDKLSEQFITKPNTVDVHDVTIALQKAQMSLDLTKAVIQRSIAAYQNIINLR